MGGRGHLTALTQPGIRRYRELCLVVPLDSPTGQLEYKCTRTHVGKHV